MAESEIIVLSVPQDSPEWFQKWARGTNFKLNKASKNFADLSVFENLSAKSIEIPVKDGQLTTITHGFKRDSYTILTSSGRILYFTTVSRTANSCIIVPRLPFTTTIDTSSSLTSQIEVTDGSIFNRGDLVAINTHTFQITEKNKNNLTLSNPVDISKQRVVRLFRETVTFIIL